VVLNIYVVTLQSSDESKDTLRPVKELRAFEKVWNSGEVDMSLDASVFATSWNVASKRFLLPCEKDGAHGTFTVYVATSSVDVIETTSFACTSVGVVEAAVGGDANEMAIVFSALGVGALGAAVVAGKRMHNRRQLEKSSQVMAAAVETSEKDPSAAL
jgi:hypothetical protein